MTSFSTPVLVRLQELKLWQGNYSNLQNQSEHSSDYDTIEGISALDSPRTSPKSRDDWDKRVLSPSKPFDVLLEEKLAEVEEPVVVENKPKKPFLKKGSGLARYNLQNRKNDVKTQIKRTATMAKNKKTTTKSNNSNKKEPHKTIEYTPLKVPDLIIKPKAKWYKVAEETPEEDPKGSYKSCKLLEWMSVEQTPTSQKCDITDVKDNPFNSVIIGKINEFAMKKFGPPATNSQCLKSPPKKRIHDFDTEKDLKIFEALEQRADNSSFCSTNSSVLRILSSTPHKKLPLNGDAPNLEDLGEADDKTKKLEDKLKQLDEKTEVINNFIYKMKMFKNESTQLDSSVEKSSILATLNEYSDEEKWSSRSSSVVSEDFCENTTLKTVEKIDIGVNTSATSFMESEIKECDSCESLKPEIVDYRKRLRQLKQKNENLLDENEELRRAKEKLEREALKAKRAFEDEKICLKQELEEEKKKAAKERMVFETYTKDSHNRSNKKDRDEISHLKSELATTKELMKLKETKNGATQARLRNQIKTLEKEVQELKDQVTKLTKENAKFTATQKLNRRPSDTKMLHEINKTLSKLTEETKKIQVNKSEDAAGGDKKEATPEKVVLKSVLKKSKESVEVNSENSSQDSSNMDSTYFSNLTLEKQYESVFQGLELPVQNNSLNESKRARIETVLPDGSKEVKYSNGNVKTISPDENLIIVKYYNGDIKHLNAVDKSVKYFYAEANTWHTTYADGTEFVEFPNGQSQKKTTDGKCEVTYPDGMIQIINTDGSEIAKYPDGSVLTIKSNGDRVLCLPNGQKEIHTKEQKRREYPDGTVKILYPDGSQETRYANGRVRIKDPQGVLIMDTAQSVLN